MLGKLFPGSWWLYAIGAGAIYGAGVLTGWPLGDAFQSRETAKCEQTLNRELVKQLVVQGAALSAAARNDAALRQALSDMEDANASLSADLEAARNQSPEIIIREVEKADAPFSDFACLTEPTPDGMRRADEARREAYR